MTRRILLLAAVALALTAPAFAASLPLRINFQGKLLDPATNAPKNGSQTVKFDIYDAASGGNLLWGPETQTVTATNGVFSAQLGSVLALSPDVFANGQTYLGVTVGTDAEMTPRQQLVMSPYSYASAQLVQASDIRVNAGLAYSTFTAAGNLQVAAGVVASSGSFSGGVTASSGTFTATGPAQYSLQTSSGIEVLAGTLSAPQIAVGAQAAHAVVPAGALVLFNGSCPSGWTEFTAAQGLYLVGVPAAGTVGGTVGTAMADLDNTGHSHAITGTAAQARSGTGQAVISALTSPDSTVSRSAIAPYIQLRLCIVP